MIRLLHSKYREIQDAEGMLNDMDTFNGEYQLVKDKGRLV